MTNVKGDVAGNNKDNIIDKGQRQMHMLFSQLLFWFMGPTERLQSPPPESIVRAIDYIQPPNTLAAHSKGKSSVSVPITPGPFV